MKIHVVQKNITDTNLTPYLDKAAEAAVDLICFGEMATTGCLYEPREVEAVELVAHRLKPYQMHIMLGLPCVNQLGAYNSYMWYHQGQVELYHKINLFPPFGEPNMYLPGERPGVFKTDLGTFGVAICYDIRFANIFEDLTRARAKKIFIPAAFPKERIDDWRQMVIARASETKRDIIAINSVGDDGINVFGGCSMVVKGDGTIIAEADQTSETVLEVELAQ